MLSAQQTETEATSVAGYNILTSTGTITYSGSLSPNGPYTTAIVTLKTTGPVFYPAVQAVRARVPSAPAARGVYMGNAPGIPLPRRGRSSEKSGAPIRNPANSSAFYPLGSVRARLIRTPPRLGRYRGRVPAVPSQEAMQGAGFGSRAGSAGAQVENPTPDPSSSGGPAHQGEDPADFLQRPGFTQPSQYACHPYPPGTRVDNASTPGVFQPGAAWPGQLLSLNVGPPFIRLFRRSVLACAYPFLKGRTTSNPGARVGNPQPRPVFAQGTSPARSRVSPRTWSKGRTSSSPGAPVRNPVRGPPVYPQTGPAGLANRAPGPFRKGSVLSNPGAPVVPVAAQDATVFSYGTPYFEWEYGTPYFEWEYGTPYTS